MLGTSFFDDDWLFSAAGERKMTHIDDFIDVAIFAKQNELAKSVAVCGTNPSGSLTVLSSVLREPYLFNGAAVMVSFKFMTHSESHL